MFCKDPKLNEYIYKKCNKQNVNIIISGCLNSCAAVTYLYKNKYEIIISSDILEKEKIFAILHELSHIKLKFLGERYEKKSSHSITEKIVNFNMILDNRIIIKNKWKILLLIYCLISEKLLIKKIRFGVDKNV